MKSFKNILFIVPLLALIYMYANQGVGVLMGSPEHYNVLAPLGWSSEITMLLVWVSAAVDLGMALALLVFPGTAVFVAAGLWTWVPRLITFMAPGPENEILESLAVLVLAVLSYLAYTRGHSIRKLFTKKSAA